MADLFTLLSTGSLIEKRDIVEESNPPNDILLYLRKFFPEEVYNLNENSVLYKFMFSLLGDSGVSGVKKAFFSPRAYTTLTGTNFNDIDTLFSNIFGLLRAKDELYEFDPYNQLLTERQWSSIKYKDGSFKARSSDYMRFFQYGNTFDGMKLLARSTSGYESHVHQNWTYIDDINSQQIIGIPNLGRTDIFEEIVILPSVAQLTVEEERRVTETMHRFIPMNGIVTVDVTEGLLDEIAFSTTNMESTSNYFYISKKVTGRNSIEYTYSSTNNWIETGEPKEAPYSMYDSRSETIETIPVYSATTSTTHIGAFNDTQKRLFSHLLEIDDDKNFAYTASNALYTKFKNSFITTPWIYRKSTNIGVYTIDTNYPVGYFANQQNSVDKKVYWASEERIPSVDPYETIELDFLSKQPINNLSFELCQKPIDFVIFYLDDEDEWQEVTMRTDVFGSDDAQSVYFTPNSPYTWQYLNPYFEVVETNKIKVEFFRRSDPFPYVYSEEFAWSIEVRELRAMYSVFALQDFVNMKSVDALGNAFSTSVNEYSLENKFVNNKNKYWKSQINPSPFAVEAVYFDVSTEEGDWSAIDEIYTDPLTPGCIMHVYYSNDESTDVWENKLWNPVPRHYVLSKGNVHLPTTVFAKYFKLEFTKLSSIPYNFPSTKSLIRYRLYPTWVEELSKELIEAYDPPLTSPHFGTNVEHSFLNTGIATPKADKLTPEISKSILDFIKDDVRKNILDEYQVWKNPETETNEGRKIVDRQNLSFYPNFSNNLYRSNVLSTVPDRVTDSNFYEVTRLSDGNAWQTESAVVPKKVVNISLHQNREFVEEEKKYPDMWFMRKCRHAYKVVESPRYGKIGYYVGLRDVKFYKRDKTKVWDDRNYIITLFDEAFTEENQFTLNDWRWSIPPNFLLAAGQNVFPEYSSENFDGVAFA
jgi:hypothetical protein